MLGPNFRVTVREHLTRNTGGACSLDNMTSTPTNVLIWSNIPLWDTQQSVLIEEALTHRRNGHNVSLLLCKSALIGCPANPRRRRYRCVACRVVQASQRRRLSKFGFNFISLRLGLKERINFRVSRAKLRLAPPPRQEMIFQETMGGLPTGAYAISEVRGCPKSTKLTPSDLRMASQVLHSAPDLQRFCRQIQASKQITKVVCWNGRRMSDGFIAECFQGMGTEVRSVISGNSLNTYLAHDGPYVLGDLNNRFTHFREATRVKPLDHENGKKLMAEYANGGRYPGAPPVVKGPLNEFSNRLFYLAITSNWAIETSHLPDSFEFESTKMFEAYLEKLDRAVTVSEKEIVLRWHPNLAGANRATRSWLDGLIKKYSNLLHLRPENPINTYALVDQAELVVDFGSTVGVYADAIGKPAVHLTPNSRHVDDIILDPESLLGVLQAKDFNSNRQEDLQRRASEWFQFLSELELDRRYTRISGPHGPAFFRVGDQWSRLSPPWYFIRPSFVRDKLENFTVARAR